MTQSDAPKDKTHCGGSNCPFEYSCVDGCMYPNYRKITVVKAADAPNEGREEKPTDGPWVASYDEDKKNWIVETTNGSLICTVARRAPTIVNSKEVHHNKVNAELLASVQSLRDQLSKEREKNENPENLLVEMSVTLNNLVRAYDQKDEGLMKFTMQKAHDLSHKGIGHLTELDKLNEQLEKEREMRKELVEGMKNISRNLLIKRNASTINKLEFLIAKASELDKN